MSGQKLSNRPGDLYVLWREYALGVNGGKPARDYSLSERGANGYAYLQRKIFWNAICSLTTRDTDGLAGEEAASTVTIAKKAVHQWWTAVV